MLSQILDGSNDRVEAAGAVNDSIDLNCFAANLVERQVIADNEDSITSFSQLGMPGNNSLIRMKGKFSNGAIEFFDEGDGPFGVNACDPIMNR